MPHIYQVAILFVHHYCYPVVACLWIDNRKSHLEIRTLFIVRLFACLHVCVPYVRAFTSVVYSIFELGLFYGTNFSFTYTYPVLDLLHTAVNYRCYFLHHNDTFSMGGICIKEERVKTQTEREEKKVKKRSKNMNKKHAKMKSELKRKKLMIKVRTTRWWSVCLQILKQFWWKTMPSNSGHRVWNDETTTLY